MAGQNIWSTLRTKVKDGPMALSIVFIGLVAMILGLVFTYADYLSSLFGLQSLQVAFGIQVPGGELVVKAMAMAPQVGQMVFMALYTLDTSRRWALVVAVAWFVLDFISDVQHNSTNTLFPQGGGMNMTPTVGVAAGMNIMWFSIGAELFLVAGSAIVLTLFADAVREFYRLWYSIGNAVADAKRDAKRDSKRGSDGGSGGGGQHNQRGGSGRGSGGNRGSSSGVPSGQPRRNQPAPEDEIEDLLNRFGA